MFAWGPDGTPALHVLAPINCPSMTVSRPFATVLVPAAAVMREVVLPNGARGASQDASYYEFLAGALIGQSALRLAVSPRSNLYGSIDILPQVMRDRIIVVDRNSEVWEKVAAVLEPVYRDIGMAPEARGSVFRTGAGSPSEVSGAAVSLTANLEVFIVGAENRLQIELSPTNVLQCVATLRSVVTSPEARAALASIEGIFQVYSALDTPALTFKSDTAADHVQQFARFVTDETYRQMSRQSALLGIPARATHALLRIRRFAGELLSRPGMADVIELSSRPIEVATHIPVPTPSVVARMLNPEPRYLPPLLNLQLAREKSVADWRSANPSFIPPLDLQFDLRDAAVVGEFTPETDLVQD